MKNFYARKIFEYDPTERGKYSKYEGYSLSTSKISNPHIINTVRIELPKESDLTILSSTQIRAKEAAEYAATNYSINRIFYLSELEEITFNMKKLLTEDEYIKFGSNLVRERFIEAFIKDTLEECRENIYNRLNSLISTFYTLENGNYLIISHSFFLKIMQIYLEIGDQLFDEPKIIKLHFNSKVKTFNYGTGFNFILDERQSKIELI